MRSTQQQKETNGTDDRVIFELRPSTLRGVVAELVGYGIVTFDDPAHVMAHEDCTATAGGHMTFLLTPNDVALLRDLLDAFKVTKRMLSPNVDVIHTLCASRIRGVMATLEGYGIVTFDTADVVAHRDGSSTVHGVGTFFLTANDVKRLRHMLNEFMA